MVHQVFCRQSAQVWATIVLLVSLVPAAFSQECPTEIAGFSGEAYSVSIDQGFMVIGDPDFGDNGGRLIVYHFDGTDWVLFGPIVLNEIDPGDLFGNSVAMSGNTLVAGAPKDDDQGNNAGAVYVFEYDGVEWNQVDKLFAFDAGSNDFYGGGVDISGSRIIVSSERDDDLGTSSGSAYVYSNSGSGWSHEAKLLASDGEEYDSFGISVAISGTNAIVGASEDDDHGNSSGAAYMFEFDGTQWQQSTKLVPADGAASDFFGESVALSADWAIVGSYWDDDNGSNSGSAYVYEFDGEGWVQQAKLLASDGLPADQLGFSVSITADIAVVGATNTTGPAVGGGSAYIYAYTDGQWVQASRVQTENGTETDAFARAVSVYGGTMIAGASGRVHIFELFAQGPADMNHDGFLNFFDISFFLQAFSNNDPSADFLPDGFFNFFDISLFLQSFEAGCP